MTMMQRLIGWIAKRTSPANPDRWLVSALGGGTTTAAGITVSETSAMSATAVYACVRVLAETVASLPLHIYQHSSSRGKQLALRHPLYPVLRWQANPEMTAFQWRETMMAYLALWGNGYSQIVRDNGGRVRQLWPLRPDRMKVQRLRTDGPLVYEYHRPEGDPIRYAPEDVLHIAGLGFDGLIGLSPIGLMRTAVGLSIAAESYGAGFFGNSANPAGVLQHPGKLSDEAHQRLRRSWEERHRGPGNAGRPAILEEGMTWHQIGLPPEDAQFLETRRFQVADIARAFRVPPHMVGDLDRATFSNIEQQSIEFVTYTLAPWLERWEHAVMHKLLGEDERPVFFPAFDTRALLRGDTLSRYQSYAVARQWGWMSANDVRDAEHQNPIEGGDQYLVPLNMIPAGEPRPTPAPKAGAPAATSPGSRAGHAARSVEARMRLADSYRGVIQDAAERIVRREVADVGRQAERMLPRHDSATFRMWMEQFYRDHPDFAARQMQPAIAGLAQAIQAEAADEVGADAGMTPEMETFARDYTQAFAARHSASSLGQLRRVLDGAIEEGQDGLDAIRGRLAEWQERRPGKIALRESAQVGNAVARETYRAAGVQRVRWRTDGGCVYCRAMDGREASIRDVFLLAGEPFEPDGADRPLMPRTNIGYPPLHEACGCMIMPGQGG